MNIKRPRTFLSTCVTLIGVVCLASPLYAEGMNVKITNPDPVHDELYVKLQGDRIVGNSAKLGVSGGRVTVDALELRLHCDKDFAVRKYKFAGETIVTGNMKRTRYVSKSFYQIAETKDLAAQCNSTVQGAGTFITDIEMPVILECQDFGIFLDSVKREEYTPKLPLKVKCTAAPEIVNAQVSQTWTYSCPETPKTDQTYWEKYRYVVDGTNSNVVVAKAPLGDIPCVRAFQSSNHLMEGGYVLSVENYVDGNQTE